MDISRLYSNLIRFVRVFIRPYPISSIQYSYPNAQKLYFMMLISITILSEKKLTLSIFEHKYENKYDISNIRLYPIRLHPHLKV